MASRLGVRRDRRAATTFRLKKPVWQDPFPQIAGTEPEKRIFEALIRRRIYFVFQGNLPEFERGESVIKVGSRTEIVGQNEKVVADVRTDKTRFSVEPKSAKVDPRREFVVKTGLVGLVVPGFKPDFILPEYRVIIDPFGVFHHSLPDAVKRDAYKSVWYRGLGYEFIHPWWDDRGFTLEDNGLFTPVGFDANAVIDQSRNVRLGPRFKLKDKRDIDAKRLQGYRIGVNLGAGANSVAIANHKRARPRSKSLRVRGRRRSTRS